MFMHKKIVFGGTFDHLHKGHKSFIQYAYTKGEYAVIGLTVDEIVLKKEHTQSILSYDQRKKELSFFLDSIGKNDQYTIIPIHDIYGTTLEDEAIEAIVVTDQTIQGSTEINIQRKKRSKMPLSVYVCPMEQDTNFLVISSTRIRKGEINRDGFVYESLCKKDIVFFDSQLETLKKPLGRLYTNTQLDDIHPSSSCLLIGDAVTDYFTQQKHVFTLAVCDGKTERKTVPLVKRDGYTYIWSNLVNHKGTLNHELFFYMKDHMKESNTIHFINGEEDLLAIYAVLLSPLGSSIYYGQPIHEGIVELFVTEALKEQMKLLILQ